MPFVFVLFFNKIIFSESNSWRVVTKKYRDSLNWTFDWQKQFDLPLSYAKSFKKFRNTLVKVRRSISDLRNRIHHLFGLKLLTRLRFGLSHINEHKFKHNFNCINQLCTCSFKVDSTKHFFLHCYYYSALLISLLNNLNISPPFALLPEEEFIKTLYDSPNFWWKWQSQNTWNLKKKNSRLIKI